MPDGSREASVPDNGPSGKCRVTGCDAPGLRDAVVEFFRKVDVNGGIPACPVTIYAKAAARLREAVRDAR